MHGPRPEWSTEVDGADALFDWFGYWPDFHDAEILSVTLDRSGSSSVRIHTWETTDEVDSQGYYVWRKHLIVCFLLDDISDVELNGFSSQNVISSARVVKSNGAFLLQLSPCYGLAGSITAARLRILIEPTTPGACVS